MEHRHVYQQVKAAINRGELVRPEACEQCGTIPGPASDGRSMIHAHHSDYSKPLDVEWLCAKCHRKETPLPAVMGAPCFGDQNGMRTKPGRRSRGAKNGFSRLTEDAVRDIKRRRHKAIEYANKYGVSHHAVYDIWHGRTWSWIAAAPEADHHCKRCGLTYPQAEDGCPSCRFVDERPPIDSEDV